MESAASRSSCAARYNRAIRAPNISELFLPRQENFPQYTDPCNVNSSFRTARNAAPGATALCVAQGIPAASIDASTSRTARRVPSSAATSNLQPEEADTYTLRLRRGSRRSTTDWLQQASASSVDYFDYEITDVISSLTASSIIGRCFNQLNGNPTFDLSNQFCQLFTRNAGNFGITDVVTTQTQPVVVCGPTAST